MNWAHSIWYGSQYGTAHGRTVRLGSPRWIFACPCCEYRMTAIDELGARTLRRIHVRIHPRDVRATVDALDAMAAAG